MRNIPRRAVFSGCAILLAITGSGTLRAAEPRAAGKRVALQGYDPVSYFTEGLPQKGSAEYQASYDDVTYWFMNAEHRALFVADPDHYAPQFNGYCAINISRGEKYEADPEAWVIADGKLYMFGAKEGVPLFRRQTAGIVEKASENWAGLRGKP